MLPAAFAARIAALRAAALSAQHLRRSAFTTRHLSALRSLA